MRIINGSVFVGEGFVERDVFVAEGRFVGEAARAEGGQTVDAAGCYVIPGLVDLHFHGSAGADISDGDLAGLHRMGAYEASRGVTAMCPATMTLPEDVLMRAAQAAAAYEPAADEAALVGINMEGPFISPSKVGAQNPDYVRNPSAEEFRRLQEAAGGLFKLVDAFRSRIPARTTTRPPARSSWARASSRTCTTPWTPCTTASPAPSRPPSSTAR